MSPVLLRIHPPDVIGKYAPDSVIGAVGSGVAAAASAAPKAGGGGPIRTAGKGEVGGREIRRGRQRLVRKESKLGTMLLGVTWTGRRTGVWTSTRAEGQ